MDSDLHMNSKRNAKIHNAGFSLVELIIVVSILAIAAVPLMKSMGMAARTNAKAQSIQNATSLAESVMEEMKSTPIEDLKTRYAGKYSMDPSGDVMTITMSDETATQGEKFDVTVTIDKGIYASGDESTKAETVLAANKKKLPSIEEIDTNSQAVLSSYKELNKYDKAAESFFNEKKADYDPADISTYAAITSKTVDIVKETALGSHHGVKVTATVTYEDNVTPTPNKYVRELYTGTFLAVQKDGSTEYNDFDSNIYIFYTQGILPETINISDNSSVPIPPGTEDTDSHRVYFIRQISGSPAIPDEITFSGVGIGSFKASDIDDLEDGCTKYGKIEFITNFGDNIDADGHIYKEEARNRVYDITVVLTKDGDTTEYAKLNSTVTASDEITPTPTTTPTPTPTSEP
ncbi:MAG: type II secretion system protein [Lachnospiraceae bacterium]|nr:type II secretion system protein [Lachnospiraceae bacterium]